MKYTVYVTPVGTEDWEPRVDHDDVIEVYDETDFENDDDLNCVILQIRGVRIDCEFALFNEAGEIVVRSDQVAVPENNSDWDGVRRNLEIRKQRQQWCVMSREALESEMLDMAFTVVYLRSQEKQWNEKYIEPLKDEIRQLKSKIVNFDQMALKVGERSRKDIFQDGDRVTKLLNRLIDEHKKKNR